MQPHVVRLCHLQMLQTTFQCVLHNAGEKISEWSMDNVITCLYKNILQMLPWSKPCKKCDRLEQWLQLFPAFLSVFCRTKSCARHKTILENSCRVVAFILTQVFARFSEKNVRLFDTYVIDRQHDTYCCSYIRISAVINYR